MGEKFKDVYVVENKAKKGILMISFKSPLKLDAKGNKKQVNKSMGRKFSDNEVREVIARDIQTILDNPEYYSSYDGYVKAKEEFHPKAIEAFFSFSEFENIYNDQIYKDILEEKIPIKEKMEDVNNKIEITKENWRYSLPSFVLLGLPGGGKTTLEKQIIGAMNSGFPATSQSNTTIGSLELIVRQSLRELKIVSTFYTVSFIKEKVKGNVLDKIIDVIAEKDTDEQEMYEGLCETSDRKFKFNFLLGDSSEFGEEIIKRLQEIAKDIWERFCKENTDVNHEYADNNNSDLDKRIKEFLEEQDEVTEIIDDFMERIDDAYQKAILQMIEELHGLNSEGKEIEFKGTIVGKGGRIELHNQMDFEATMGKVEKGTLPQYVEIEIFYCDKERRPDKSLRDKFFKICEFMSSADERMRGKTLFPLIRATRVAGNFRPLWKDEDAQFKDFIIIDSEGFGHDLANKEIPKELREVLLKSDRIRWVQDGSKPVTDNNKELLKYLIVSGYIRKTDFCMNRLEEFDLNSYQSINSRKKYIRQGLESLVDALVNDEAKLQDKIVTGKDRTYKKLINERTYLFEYLNQVIQNGEYIVTSNYIKLAKTIEKFKSIGDCEEDIKNLESMMQSEKISFDTEINTVKNIERLVDVVERKKEPEWYDFQVIYKYDKFVHGSASISRAFKKEFMTNLNESTWQTIKAFNNRIAYDYDGREWGRLKPEAILERIIKTNIYGFLVNPDNVDDIVDMERFLECVDYIAQNIAIKVTEIVREHIVNAKNKEGETWKTGADLYGNGSTSVRYWVIQGIIDYNFEIDYEKGKYDKLYDDLKKCVIDNKFFKGQIGAKVK